MFTNRFNRTLLSVPREIVPELNKNFGIPQKFLNIPRNVAKSLSGSWQYWSNLVRYQLPLCIVLYSRYWRLYIVVFSPCSFLVFAEPLSYFSGLWTFPQVGVPWDIKLYIRGSSKENDWETLLQKKQISSSSMAFLDLNDNTNHLKHSACCTCHLLEDINIFISALFYWSFLQNSKHKQRHVS